MSNVFSKIAQLFSSNKEGQRPQSTEAQASSSQATTSQSAASCSHPAINLTHIDLPTAPSFGTRSLEEVRAAAEGGDAEAQYLLFDYYASGHGEGSDRPAFEWLTKAAEQGYPLALYTSALIQIEEKEGAAVPPLALFYLQASGERGFSDAYLQLYHLYRDGKGVEANEDTALSYLRKAMEAGSGTAYLIVAKGFLPGNGGGPLTTMLLTTMLSRQRTLAPRRLWSSSSICSKRTLPLATTRSSCATGAASFAPHISYNSSSMS